MVHELGEQLLAPSICPDCKLTLGPGLHLGASISHALPALPRQIPCRHSAAAHCLRELLKDAKPLCYPLRQLRRREGALRRLSHHPVETDKLLRDCICILGLHRFDVLDIEKRNAGVWCHLALIARSLASFLQSLHERK